MHDVIVIGGGIAGLTAAWTLKRGGLSVVVLEEKDHAGGNVRTVENDGCFLESGPHSFLGSSEHLWRLLETAGLVQEAEAAAPAAANRYIFRDGKLLPLPLSAGQFIGSRLLSFKGKLRLAMEPFIRGGARPEDTAWDFFVRRFGEEAATYIMSPFISGIYAGDIRCLGARAAFPKFWRFEHESGSMIRGALAYMRAKRRRFKAEGRPLRKGLFSMRGGLGRVTGFLHDDLGSAVLLGRGAGAVESTPAGLAVHAAGSTHEARSVILAAPPQRAAAVLAGRAAQASALLASIPLAPVALVHWAIPEDRMSMPAGFGFLVPRTAGLRLLGTLFPSQLFSGRAPAGTQLMASYFGGEHDRQVLDLSDREMVGLLRAEHAQILGTDPGEPSMLKILRVPHAIPQLLPDHVDKVAQIRAHLAALPGLFLAGNYLAGVGIEQAVESGFAAADQARAFMEGRHGV